MLVFVLKALALTTVDCVIGKGTEYKLELMVGVDPFVVYRICSFIPADANPTVIEPVYLPGAMLNVGLVA